MPITVRELVEQLLDHPPDAYVHVLWNGVVMPPVEKAIEGRIMEAMGGALMPIDKSVWDRFPDAKAVVLLKDDWEDKRTQPFLKP